MPEIVARESLPSDAAVVAAFITKAEFAGASPILESFADVSGFEAKPGQTLGVPAATAGVEQFVADADPNQIVLLLGIGGDDVDGDDESTPETATTWRKAGAALARAAKKHSIAAAVVPEAAQTDEAVAAIVDGIRQVSYRYTRFHEKPAPDLATVQLIGPASMQAAIDRATVVADAIDLAKELTNDPGGTLTPTVFAARAEAEAAAAGFSLEVWTEDTLADEAMGGILAVNQGSHEPPRMLIMRHSGSASDKNSASVALVGKGVTFDSGGLSLKPPASMMTMKIDMAGGAAVLAAMTAIARLDLPLQVTGYVPLTDNMTGGGAQRPGDVFTARNGKTVEVLNTDAEGRLILADALSLASEAKPDAIIDIATLTGSASAALGIEYAAVMASDDALFGQLESASAATDDKIWRLPLVPEYRPQLDSDVAELKNIGAGAFGGAIVAGLFLQEFVADSIPWAHIDVGLAVYSEKDGGLATKGGTGFGVKLLVEALTQWQ